MPIGQFSYNVDLVMIIDVTGSMGPIINKVKETALTLPRDFLNKMDEMGKHAEQVRFKVITFGDYKYDTAPMTESRFFESDEASEFENYVNNIRLEGGGDLPENALEALAYAIKSDWVTDGTMKRHIIALFTDAPALPLGARADCPEYPTDLPKSFPELLDWYSGLADPTLGLKIQYRAKRLILFAPHAEPWDNIAEFETVIHLPIAAGNGGSELNVDDVIELFVNAM